MGILHGDRHNENQLVHYRPSEYKLRDIVGGDGCAMCTELKLVELLQEELTRRASEIRVKINLSHSAINRQLPPEILGTIFEAYVDDPSYEDFLYEADVADCRATSGNPLLLGAVCRTWRDIAWSTPRLWTSLTVHVDFARQPTQTRLTQEWLARSGKLPLSIRLVDYKQRNDDINLIRPLISAINQYAQRWRNLHIHLPTCMFPWFKPVGNHVPMLEYLKVEGKHHFANDDWMDENTRDLLWLGDTPSLKYLSTSRISLINLKVGWENVTHFAGENVSIAECLEIVRRAPLLEHCVFQSTSGSTEDLPPPSAPILVQRLRTFSVTFPNQGGLALMQSVTSPALETLAVVGPLSGCLPAFFVRSHCPLQRLSLTFFGDDPKCLIDLLRTQPSLTALSLGWSPLPGLLLAELAATHDADPAGPPAFLPNLETLEFLGMNVDFAWSQLADIFLPLVNDVGERAQGDETAAPTRLYVRPWRRVKMTVLRDVTTAGRAGLPYIPEAVLPRLRKAIACGVEVEVKVTASFDGCDMKDWLQVSEEHHEVRHELSAETAAA